MVVVEIGLRIYQGNEDCVTEGKGRVAFPNVIIIISTKTMPVVTMMMVVMLLSVSLSLALVNYLLWRLKG